MDQRPKAEDATAPTFSPVVSPSDVVAEKRWEEFMRWLVKERPQVASIFQDGKLESIDGGVVKMKFSNPFHADMLSEDDRRSQVEGLFESFFKKKMRLSVGRNAATEQTASPSSERSEKKKELVKEALGSDVVKQAADIFGAKLHEVKTSVEK